MTLNFDEILLDILTVTPKLMLQIKMNLCPGSLTNKLNLPAITPIAEGYLGYTQLNLFYQLKCSVRNWNIISTEPSSILWLIDIRQIVYNVGR